MASLRLTAFADEMAKMASDDWWSGFMDDLRSAGGSVRANSKIRRQVDYHFSEGSGLDRWDKLLARSNDPVFSLAMASHPQSDEKLVMHVQSMGALSRAPTVGKVVSLRLPGRSYEIKDLGSRMGCTCGDWRFRGSVNHSHDCKHIQAHRQGKTEVDDVES